MPAARDAARARQWMAWRWSRWMPVVAAVALVAATFLAYFPAARAGFIWDDDWYLTKNPLLNDWRGLARIWVPGNTPQYYPVVFTTFWIEHQIWKLEPAGYHLVNVALHALNALLIWRLARVLAIPGAGFVAAVFALHPVHVETVAWITERKNVLSGCFYLLAALAWLRFEQRREQDGRAGWRWYGVAFLLFVLALLSKSVTCSLVAALPIMRLWQRRRVTRAHVLALAPMFVVGLLLALHTAYLERAHVGAAGAEFDFTFGERTLLAARALCFYPLKLFVPWPLSFVYPRWQLAASGAAFGCAALVLVVAAVALVAWRRGARGPALALAFFAVTIFPALGFFNVYPMRYSFVADHFQYLASLGLLALAIGPMGKSTAKAAASAAADARLKQAVGAIVLAGLGVLTWRQCSIYADEETLWRATLERNPGAWIAHNNLATLASARGANDEALDHLQTALTLTSSEKSLDQIHFNRATTLGKLGRNQEALEELERLQRKNGGMELKLARALEKLGRDPEAETLYRQALERAPGPDGLMMYGMHLLRLGRPIDAVPWLERLIALQPEDADARMVLADAYAGADRLSDAIASGERALAIARSQGRNRSVELIRRRLAQFRAGAPAPIGR